MWAPSETDQTRSLDQGCAASSRLVPRLGGDPLHRKENGVERKEMAEPGVPWGLFPPVLAMALSLRLSDVPCLWASTTPNHPRPEYCGLVPAAP